MKKTAWKAFIDYEKEEDWLNSMSAKGLALTDYFFFRYAFEDSRPGEYIYRIELLDNPPGHAESRAYLDFMAENGVEHVTSWIRWVYFRKRASGGPFDIYSDIDSRITHYKRILTLWLPLMCMDLMLGLINFSNGVDSLFGNENYGIYNLVIGVVLIALAAVIFFYGNSFRLKIRRLRQEKTLRE